MYQGKHILLSAKFVYKWKGDERRNLSLLPHRVCLIENGDTFETYPEENEVDNVIEDYRMTLFEEDHELYNTCITRVNAKKNDARLRWKKKIEENKKSSLDDITDIEEKILNEKMKPCEVLESEFNHLGHCLDALFRRKLSREGNYQSGVGAHTISIYVC